LEWGADRRPQICDFAVLAQGSEANQAMTKKPLLRLQGIEAAPMTKNDVGEAFKKARKHRLINNLSPWKRKPKQ
jgi:hypothetical protein